MLGTSAVPAKLVQLDLHGTFPSLFWPILSLLSKMEGRLTRIGLPKFGLKHPLRCSLDLVSMYNIGEVDKIVEMQIGRSPDVLIPGKSYGELLGKASIRWSPCSFWTPSLPLCLDGLEDTLP